MNYGVFFRLNNAKSNLGHGIAVFDYIWLEDNEARGDTPKFPIYLTISSESIDFHAHYYVEYKDETGNPIRKHQHNTILSLPISANLEVKDGLTDALVEGWKTTFPKWDEYSNYLYKKLTKAFETDNGIGLCYADLPIFNEDTKKSIIKEVIENIDKYKDKYIFNKFIRILILDFLFDLEHTKVFQSSRYYEHISVKLRENFFFNALANKAMYYFYREKAKEYVKDEKEDAGKVLEPAEKVKMKEKWALKKFLFLKDYFLPAEEQWIKSIMNPRSDDVFTLKKNKWFDDPCEEMFKIYNSDAINGIELYNAIEPKQKKIIDSEDKIEEKIKKITVKVSKWQLGKFDFQNAKVSGIIRIAGLLCFLLFIIMLLFRCVKTQNIGSFIILFLLAWFILSCVGRVVQSNFNYNNFIYLHYSHGVHLFLIRLFGSITAAWISFSFSSGGIIGIFKNISLYCFGPIIVSFSLLLFTFMLVYNEIRNTVQYIKPCEIIKRSFLFLSVAFCYSFIIGLLATEIIGIKYLKDPKINHVFEIPDYLMVFTLVAMFLGIFIHLIFPGRKIIDVE